MVAGRTVNIFDEHRNSVSMARPAQTISLLQSMLQTEGG